MAMSRHLSEPGRDWPHEECIFTPGLGSSINFLRAFMAPGRPNGNTLISCRGRNEKATLGCHPFRAPGFEPHSGCARRRCAGNHLRRVRDSAVRGYTPVFNPPTASACLHPSSGSETSTLPFWSVIWVGLYTRHRHRSSSIR